LSPKAFTKLWNTLIDLGDPGVTIPKAWIAKDLLRQILTLAGTGADRSVISHRLYRFHTWCADAEIPELERLAATIETRWACIEAFLHTQITNAKSEGSKGARATTGSSNSMPGTPTATATPPANAYAHAAQPPAAPEDTSTPVKFEDPSSPEIASAAIPILAAQ
jgi:hypothetical protein